jgi:hypothetical protein
MLLAEGAAEQVAEHAPPEPELLPAKPEEFWGVKPMPTDLLGDINLPRAIAALPRRLGNLQFWRGELPLMQVLEPSYENAARAGERVLADEFAGH